MKVGGAIVLVVGCGRNDRNASLIRGEPCLKDAAGGEGEACSESLVSLADLLKCLRTVVLGNTKGEGAEAAFQKQVMLRGGRKQCHCPHLQVQRMEQAWVFGMSALRTSLGGVHTSKVKAGGISNLNLIPPLSSSPTHISSTCNRH